MSCALELIGGYLRFFMLGLQAFASEGTPLQGRRLIGPGLFAMQLGWR
jgi:hypothetical protein